GQPSRNRAALPAKSHPQQGQSIGVVEATQGQHWYDLTLIGQEAHAGPTPMSSRRDALMGMSRIALAADEISREEPPGCATVGRVEVFPNSPNTIPGRVMFSCDLRHPDRQKLTRMDQHFRDRAAEISGDMNLTLELSQRVYIPPMPFNVPLADAVADAAQQVGEPWRRMYTGAGHDACNVARHLPTAMVFIPCRDGISHNEAEHAEPEHVAAGVQVLATTLLAAANGEINFAS
ncbi:MAG: hydantoinase/carbamoylase family amidase, partial [Pseudomonadota bacterium]